LQRLLERVDDSFTAAVSLLKSTVESGAKILIVGVGKSGNIGNKLAATLNSTGAPAAVLNCQDAIHGDLGLVNAGDSVIALSYSGETAEFLALLPHLKRRGARLVAITGKPGSTLGKAADCVLDIHVRREACPLNLAPTSSTTAMLALGDALAMVLLEARGFRQDDFARFHPGGSLGRVLLTRVNQIMRKATQLAVASPDCTVLEVLKKMTKCRTGAAAIVEADGKLSGVFTHGDLARHYQKHTDLGALPVGKFMTKNPITIRGDKLAAEALHVLKTHRIDDLIVVDEDNRPVGIIDSQDLSRLQGV